MKNKAAKGDADPLKLVIHGCHDTSLAGMAQTFDVFDGQYAEDSFLCAHISHPPAYTVGPNSLHTLASNYSRRQILQTFTGDGCDLRSRLTVCFILASHLSIRSDPCQRCANAISNPNSQTSDMRREGEPFPGITRIVHT